MKKIALFIVGALLLSSAVWAGGIITNTNQSAAWIRTLVRDASVDGDAVYFNPAGLTKLSDGLHLSLSSQTIFQNKNVTNDFEYLTGGEKEYKGKVSAPVFPSIYATYKMDKLALSFGFNPVGGGGGATFDDGLPSFEVNVTSLVPKLKNKLGQIDAATGSTNFSNITGYNADIFFEGTSVYFGFQLGASYEINDVISVAIGGRYISAKNTYNGHLKSITIDAPASYGGTQTPGNYLRTVAGAVSSMDAAQAAVLNATAAAIDAQTADKEVDAVQTGSGFTPFIGINISPNEDLNIGVKYEMATKIELTNDTEVDGTGMFPDGAKTRADMPAMLSVGASYKATSKLSVSAGFHSYFDKPAYYGKTAVVGGSLVQVSNEDFMDHNYWELGVGIEYAINDKLGVSAGYLRAQTGVNKDYQTDLSFSLSSNTIGGGLYYNLTDKMMLNLGIAYSKYLEGEKNYTLEVDETESVSYKNQFFKDNLLMAIGLDINF